MSIKLDRETIREKVEGYYKLPYEEQVELLELLRHNSLVKEEWRRYIDSLEDVHYEGEEPFLSERERKVLGGLVENVRNAHDLGEGRRKWLMDTLSIFFEFGDLGAPLDAISRLNPYTDDVEKSMNDNINLLNIFIDNRDELKFQIQVTFTPVHMRSGEVKSLEVAKLVKVPSNPKLDGE